MSDANIATLGLDLETTGIEKGDKATDALADSMRNAAKASDGLESTVKKTSETTKEMSNSVKGLIGALAGFLTVAKVLDWADSWKRAENQIKTVSSSVAEVRSAQEGLFAISQKTYSEYEATAKLYTAIERSSKGFLKNQQDALTITENVNKALAVGGAGKAEQASAILQLGQALGSGRLQGDEFRSISENAPLIQTAIAASIAKVGESVETARGRLKQLAADGKLTSDVVIKALKDMGPALEATFKNLQPTIGQALQKLDNAFEKFVGQNGATLFNGLASAISMLADHLDDVAKAALIAAPAMLALSSPQIIAGLGEVVKGVKAIGLAIASNPIGAIATALATAAVAFYAFSDQMTVATGKFTSDNKLLKGEVLDFKVTVQDVFNEIPGAIGDGLKAAGDAMGGWIKDNFSPDQLKAIQDFFMGVVDVAKNAWNLQIGLAVATSKAIVAAFSNFPALMKDIFISATNGVIQAVQDLLNKVVEAVNGFIKGANGLAASAGLKIQLPTIDPVSIAKVKNDAAGTAKAIGDTFQKDLNTDYIGNAIKVVGKGFDYLEERATKSKKAQAEALALQKQAAGDGSGYGGGVPPPDASKSKEAERWAKKVKDQTDALKLSLTNAKMSLDQFLASGERGQHLADVTGQLMSKYKDLFSARNFGSDTAARAAAEDYAKQLIAIEDAAKRAKIAAEDLFNSQASGRLVKAMSTGDVTDPITGQVEHYKDVNEALAKQEVIEGAIRDARQQGLEVTEDDLKAATARLKVSNDQYLADQKRAIQTQKAANDAVKLAATTGTVTYGSTAEQAKSAYEAITLQTIAIQVQNEALAKGLILTDQQLKDQVAQVYALQQQGVEVDHIVSRIQDLSTDAIVRTFDKGFDGAIDNFFKGLVQKGPKAIGDLFKDASSLITDAIADALKDALNPFITALKDQMSSAMKDVVGAVKNGIGDFLKNLDSSGELAKTVGSVFKTATYAYAGYQVGSGLSTAVGGNGSPQRQQNGQVGGLVGGAIGSIFGPIGSAIGAAIGSFVGGLIGPKGTDATAGANLNQSGTISGSILGSKRTDATTGALNNAITAIDAGYKALSDLGGKMSVYVTGLSIGQRDRSNANISNGTTVSGNVGDAADLANNALLAVLKNTTFTSAALNNLKDGMIAAGSSFDEVATTLQTVDAVLKSTQPALSDVEQAVKGVHDTFDPLLAKTAAYTVANKALTDSMNAALQAIAGQVNQNNADALLSLTNNVAYQYQQLLKEQTQSIKDATAAGADLNLVYELNAAKTKNFVENLASGASDFASMASAYQSLKTAMEAAGQDTTALTSAFNKSKGDFQKQFDNSVTDSLLQAQNGTLYDLKKLLDQQKERLAQANAVGGNVVAAERLNAVEIQKFFANLSADQKNSLGDYLGLIEDYTGKIGAVLSQMGDALTAATDNMKETVSGLRDTATTYNGLAKTLKDTKAALEDQYSNVTPMARLQDLRNQFTDLSSKAQAGDKTAADALSDVANKLIERSRDLFGSSSAFYSDFNLVTEGLGKAGVAAQNQADAATRQADALEAQVDLLTSIKEALQDSNPNLTFLATASQQLVDGNSAVRDLLNQYLTLETAKGNTSLSDTQLQNLASAVASGVTMVINAPVANDVQLDATSRNTAAIAALQSQVAQQTDEQAATNDVLNKILAELKKQTRNDLTGANAA